jgi:hypothetical protein
VGLSKDIRTVVFYNNCHCGDIHVSRSFVRYIVENLRGVDFKYAHRNHPSLLCDIPKLQHTSKYNSFLKNKNKDTIHHKGCLFLNTWYASSKLKFRPDGTIDPVHYGTLHNLFTHHFKTLGLNVEDKEPRDFIPSIDFSYYNTDPIDKFLKNHTGSKVLFCNGLVKSGQAINFPMLPGIVKLAQKYPNVVMIYTNREKCNAKLPPNLHFSPNILKTNGFPDLNENAYLSTHCDLIVGRQSGAYTFSMLKDNILDRPAKFINFTNSKYPTWFNKKYTTLIKPRCTTVCYHHSDLSVLGKIIEEL